MDEISKWISRLADVWHWLVGLVAGSTATFAWWKRYGIRVRRALHLSDRLHGHFGPQTAEKVIDEFQKRSRDGRVREIRQQFIEDRLGIALYVCADSGACEYVNDTLSELFGLDKAECLGNEWLKAVNPTQRQSVLEFWMYAVSHRVPYDYQYEVINQRTKEQFSIITKAFPVISREDRLLCYVGTIERVSS